MSSTRFLVSLFCHVKMRTHHRKTSNLHAKSFLTKLLQKNVLKMLFMHFYFRKIKRKIVIIMHYKRYFYANKHLLFCQEYRKKNRKLNN